MCCWCNINAWRTKHNLPLLTILFWKLVSFQAKAEFVRPPSDSKTNNVFTKWAMVYACCHHLVHNHWQLIIYAKKISVICIHIPVYCRVNFVQRHNVFPVFYLQGLFSLTIIPRANRQHRQIYISIVPFETTCSLLDVYVLRAWWWYNSRGQGVIWFLYYENDYDWLTTSGSNSDSNLHLFVG